MNNPLSDESEKFKDIFVLGRNEEQTLELIEHLENQDYRVTLFSDGPQLIDTLRLGKPNLIICDTTTGGQEAYEYCRQIKADDNLWMIPVIILTRASSLGDLLSVLDSNADNFIAQPYDIPYLLSLLEGMLTSPVERQTTEQIKTQFRIQHDDRIFVVTADRRKLLEFLLSAFEIAVKNFEDLSSANAELQSLSSRLTILEEAGIENTRVIETLNATVRKKEQDERTLKGMLEETEQALDEKTAEAQHLTRDLVDINTRLATAEDHIRIMLIEKENTDLAHQSECSNLAEQVASLSQEIAAKITNLDATQQALETETARVTKLNLAVQELNEQVDLQKASVQALTLNKEQLLSALSSEKNRADAAEEEARSVLLAKTKSEQDLSQLLDELKDVIRQKDENILRLTSELGSENDRCTKAELQCENLRHELEQSIATHEVTEESQRRQFDDLQSRCDTALSTIFTQERELKFLKDEIVVAHADSEKNAASVVSVTAALNEARREIEEREWKAQSLEKQIADAGLLLETRDENIRALTASLESAQAELNAQRDEHAALKEQLTTAIRERDETLQSVQDAHDQTKTDLEMQKNNLIQLNRDLETAALLRSTLQGDITASSSRIKELEHELKSAIRVKEQTIQQVQVLNEELDEVKATLKDTLSALSFEKVQRESAEKELENAIRERDETLQSIQKVHEQTKTDLEVQTNNLERLNRDLESAALLHSKLQGDITAASLRIEELEDALKSAIQSRDLADQQVTALNGELGEIKSAFDNVGRVLSLEKEQREAAVVQLNAAIRERDETLQSVQGAHNQTKIDLDVHRQDLLRLKRELEAANQLNSTLLTDFKAASVRITELEAELNSVVKGKEQTGQQARSLSEDLEETKAELETERRIRRETDGNLQKSAQANSRLEGDIARLTAEQEHLKVALAQEKTQHLAALEKVSAATYAKEQAEREFETVKKYHEKDEDLRSAEIQKLTRDFEQVLTRQQNLEQEIATLKAQKADAEARAEALSEEIDHARIALADEWEDHMNDEERLADSEKRARQQEQSPSRTRTGAPERECTWAVAVKQIDLPAEIRSSPKAVMVTSPVTHEDIVNPAAPETVTEEPTVSIIEDLFEDNQVSTAADPMSEVSSPTTGVSNTETPAMTPIEEPPEKPAVSNEDEAEPAPEQDTNEPDGPEELDRSSGANEVPDVGAVDDEREPEESFHDFVNQPSSYGISFNRQQWFDLVKWSHHSGALSQEQHMQIVRMGRLIQNGRRLTKKQDEQVREMIVLVQTLGYQFH